MNAKTEFGFKALLAETEERVITHYDVHLGNPHDGDLLPAAFAGHRQIIGKTPRAVATDRGFSSKDHERWLEDQGVKRISLPFSGRLSAQRRQHEHQRGSGVCSAGAAGRKQRSVLEAASTAGAPVGCEDATALRCGWASESWYTTWIGSECWQVPVDNTKRAQAPFGLKGTRPGCRDPHRALEFFMAN